MGDDGWAFVFGNAGRRGARAGRALGSPVGIRIRKGWPPGVVLSTDTDLRGKQNRIKLAQYLGVGIVNLRGFTEHAKPQ